MDEDEFKKLVKTALVEVLEERRELLVEIVLEIIEDIGLARAMDEAADSPIVDRSELQDIFDDAKE